MEYIDDVPTMRIGELLLLREAVDPWALSNVLNTQAHSRQRVISQLIARALLDADAGTALLAEQLGYPAAMQRHLENRDRALETLIPAALGARWVVLPLGRARTGELVVVARDPTPILAAALAHAARTPVLLAVTAASQIERLVRQTYGAPGPAELPLPITPPTLADLGSIALDPYAEQPRRKTVSDVIRLGSTPDLPEPRAVSPGPRPLEVALDEIDRSVSLGAAEHRAMSYAGQRWPAALLFKVVDDRAVGQRAHGMQVGEIDGIEFPLGELSSLRIAHDTKSATAARPDSDAQDRLAALLGGGVWPVTTPIALGDRVVGLIVVGAPAEPPRTTLSELDALSDALTGAHHRFTR